MIEFQNKFNGRYVMQPPHPNRLGITPIVESNLEIRFKSSVPNSAVPGMIYSALQKDYPEMEPTNILEIPESIRSHAPELQFAPLYRLVGDKKVYVSVGSNVLSIYYNKEQRGEEYPGWTSYIHGEVLDICNKINKLNIISQTTRIGLRTVDFFESINIFEKSELELNFDRNSILDDISALERNIMKDEFQNKVLIHSKVSRTVNSKIMHGSLIDIDTSLDLNYNLFVSPDDVIMRCHKVNKTIFFDLLKKDFIDTLEPIENE